MTTLLDYLAHQFPNHALDRPIDAPAEDLELTDHTVVTYGVGSGGDTLSEYQRLAPNQRVASLVVRPTSASIVPTAGEDKSGVVDLPTKRVVAAAAAGGILLAAIFTPITLAITGSVGTAVIFGVFTALMGILVGAIIGGGRAAGERSDSQPTGTGSTHHGRRRLLHR